MDQQSTAATEFRRMRQDRCCVFIITAILVVRVYGRNQCTIQSFRLKVDQIVTESTEFPEIETVSPQSL